MTTDKAQPWEAIFEGADTTGVQEERTGYRRKPAGTQDQGQKDESD